MKIFYSRILHAQLNQDFVSNFPQRHQVNKLPVSMPLEGGPRAAAIDVLFGYRSHQKTTGNADIAPSSHSCFMIRTIHLSIDGRVTQSDI